MNKQTVESVLVSGERGGHELQQSAGGFDGLTRYRIIEGSARADKRRCARCSIVSGRKEHVWYCHESDHQERHAGACPAGMTARNRLFEGCDLLLSFQSEGGSEFVDRGLFGLADFFASEAKESAFTRRVGNFTGNRHEPGLVSIGLLRR